MSQPFQIDGLDFHAVGRTIIRTVLGAFVTIAPTLIDPNIHYTLAHHDVTLLVVIGVTGVIRLIEAYMTKTN